MVRIPIYIKVIQMIDPNPSSNSKDDSNYGYENEKIIKIQLGRNIFEIFNRWGIIHPAFSFFMVNAPCAKTSEKVK